MARDRYDIVLDFYRERGYGRRLGAGARPAVLVVDFSRAFTESAARFPGGDFGRELTAARRLLDAARGRWPVCFTTIAYEPGLRDAGLWAVKVPWLATCIAGTPAVEIDSALGRRPDEPVLVKKGPSAFHGTDLAARLVAQRVDTLIVAGCTTSVCVRATVVDAMQHGYRPLIAEEAVGDFVPEIHRVHLLDLGSRYADVMPLDEILGYLARLAPAGAPSPPTP